MSTQQVKSNTYKHNDETYCDGCGRDWMLRANTQWSNGHCLLAFVGDGRGNSWMLCNRCYEKKKNLFVTEYIKKKDEEDEE